jgi:hypothetical protein
MSIAIEIESNDTLISRENDQEISTKKGGCESRSVYRRIKARKKQNPLRNQQDLMARRRPLRGNLRKLGFLCHNGMDVPLESHLFRIRSLQNQYDFDSKINNSTRDCSLVPYIIIDIRLDHSCGIFLLLFLSPGHFFLSLVGSTVMFSNQNQRLNHQILSRTGLHKFNSLKRAPPKQTLNYDPREKQYFFVKALACDII